MARPNRAASNHRYPASYCSSDADGQLQGRRALLDAAQDWRELVDLTTALKLTFVPPGRPGVDERPDCVTRLGRVAGT